MKKVVFLSLFNFLSFLINAQVFYTCAYKHTVPAGDTSNRNLTYKHDLTGCSSEEIFTCKDILDFPFPDIAVSPTGYFYYCTSRRLYRRQINDTATCEYLGEFNDGGPSLVTDSAGNVYNTNATLEKYDVYTHTFVNLGNLPPGIGALGDLFFYEGRLFGLFRSDTLAFIYSINMINPASSFVYMNLPTNMNRFFSAFSVNYPGFSKAYVIYLPVIGVDFSEVYELDMTSRTLGNLVCTIPVSAAGAASVYTFPAIDSNPPFTPVPVQLINFEYQVKDRTVKLQWKTYHEINNAYFDVEKSTDGIKYFSIGRATGYSGNSYVNQYNFTDPNTGRINYYRLKQVDFDGKFIFSKVLLVKMDSDLPIKVIENPVKETLKLQIKSDNFSTCEVKLFDINMRLLKSINVTNGINNIDVKSLSSGMFFLQLISPQRQKYTVSFIKLFE